MSLPSPLPHARQIPAVVRAVGQKTRNSTFVQLITFLTVLACLGYLAWTAQWTSPLVWLWFGVAVVASGTFVNHLIRAANWGARTFVFGSDSLLITCRGSLEQEIPYDQILAYRFDHRDPREWLTITREGGKSTVVIAHFPILWSSRELAKEFVRAIGPKLSAGVQQDRGIRPTTRVEGLIWDQYGDPLPVQMQPGVHYRYIAPDELKAKSSPAEFVWSSSSALLLFPLLGESFQKDEWNKVVFFSAILAAYMFLVFRGVPKLFGMRRAWTDEFVLKANELIVFRGERRLTFGGACRWTSFRFGGRADLGSVLRFGRGTHSYYLDPRFIEPCV